MLYTVYLTAKDGTVAKITGSDAALNAIEEAFIAKGYSFNEEAGTWDVGFYDVTTANEETE